MINVEKARHRFARQDINFIDLECFAIDWIGQASLFGESGSGKTTLFRLLSGWFSDSEYSRVVFERSFDMYNDVFFIGGHTTLLPWLSVKGNLRFLLNTEQYLSAQNFFSKIGLDSAVLGLHPRQLSLGMYKRVELSIALARRPKLLLLDEFYSSLDAVSKRKCRLVIDENRRGLPTWVIAHELEMRDWIGGTQFFFKFDSDHNIRGIIS